jgi:ABC-2 type transport system permease protein
MTFWYVAIKDIRLQLKDLGSLLVLFLTPLLVIAVAGYALPNLGTKTYSKFQVPVVQLDQGPYAQAVVHSLQSISAIDALTTYKDDNGHTQTMTLDEAKQQVPNLKAAIIIPEGFSQAVEQKQSTQLIVLTDPADHTVPPVVTSIAQQVAAKISGTSSTIAVNEQVNQTSANYHSPTAFDSTVPGYAVMFMLFSTSLAAASLLMERESGTLRKLKTLPISRGSIVLGKVLANFLVALLQCAVLFITGHYLFGLWFGNDPLALVLLMVLTAFASTGLGMLIAAFIKTRAQASGIVTLCVLAMSALGGSWWPLYIEPSWMQQIAHITLTAWAMNGFNQLLVYGNGIAAISASLAVLTGIGIGGIIIATARFRYE